MSWNARAEDGIAYSSGLRYPTDFPACWLIRAINPEYKGATALVPPITPGCPSTTTSYPLAGSASPDTSGTPRPTRWSGFDDGGTRALFCQVGRSKVLLMPPPVAPPPGPSFHAVSLVIWFPEPSRWVPPQPNAFGLEAGKSTWLNPSCSPSLDPLSPEAHQTVTPILPAA